jgi:hypothetical protein
MLKAVCQSVGRRFLAWGKSVGSANRKYPLSRKMIWWGNGGAKKKP